MPALTALLIVGAVVLLGLLVGIALRARDGRERAGGSARVRVEDVGSGVLGSAALVQFSTEFCARCPQVRRLLGAVAHDAGIPLAEIDLTHRGDLASRYGVLQTPTTFLVDASGAVVSRWGGVPERASIEAAVTALATAHPCTVRSQEQP